MDKERKLLLRSLDSDLSDREKGALGNALSASPDLRQMKDELLATRGLLHNYRPSFRNGFADRVVARLANRETAQSWLDMLWPQFSKVAFAGVAATVCLVAVTYYGTGSLSVDHLFGLSDYFDVETLLEA